MDRVRKHCETVLQVPFVESNVFAEGGKGGLELARIVVKHAEKASSPFHPLYDWNDAVTTKIETVAREMYGAKKIIYTKKAERDLMSIEKLGYGNLPVCIAKTPTSLTDDPKIYGRPENFPVTVQEIRIAAGAGFLIPITGDIMRMPGLPKNPQAENIDVAEGKILGIK
ncbi:MAG: formate--tetrahydrofolate ligase [Nitrospinae bacterium]|nr:formate--tetrahydrofolate ligase [Nitrospinota bacterium]